jgi:metal-responsive CopG/Arc/MetJ family transcriptional regulator
MKMAAAHVPDEILEALDRIAETRQVERTKVIRWALVEYIERFFNRPFEMTKVQSEEHSEPAAEVA